MRAGLRVVGVIVAAVLACLAVAEPSPGATSSGWVQAYTYDSHHHPVLVVDTASEPGPPAMCHRAITSSAVDHWWHGALARSDGPTPRTESTYDNPAGLVKGTQPTATTSEPAQLIGEQVAALRGWRVAANAAPRLLSPSSLADEVANATGGVLKTNKGGFTIDVPNGARGITVRVMERGGSRTNYYRVSVPGKETYTITGETSTDAALTHMDIGESSLDDILSIIARIQGAG